MLRKKKKGGERKMIDAIIFQLSEHSRFDPYQDTSSWYPRYESKESPPQRSNRFHLSSVISISEDEGDRE